MDGGAVDEVDGEISSNPSGLPLGRRNKKDFWF
jgi:hypothetical protein